VEAEDARRRIFLIRGETKHAPGSPGLQTLAEIDLLTVAVRTPALANDPAHARGAFRPDDSSAWRCPRPADGSDTQQAALVRAIVDLVGILGLITVAAATVQVCRVPAEEQCEAGRGVSVK
jgi:hypothetical protein